jgi:hypothetical protein
VKVEQIKKLLKFRLEIQEMVGKRKAFQVLTTADELLL